MVKYVTNRGGYELVQWERSFPSVHAIRKNPFLLFNPGWEICSQHQERKQGKAANQQHISY